ncbi:DNA polymerase IV [Phaeodactylibacter luteus]|uniref:DNA polymerase IV n=1 Tax=Phaeodactylibacter luteus TaxID=1564516 RepID=A0A5C6RI52_9BACT|nr:DNA polymerase IV [Phaeodactylibacter luteus]TXB61724.1 DNA polymerase IV [Phaeodactylibacter luteus]
MESSRKIIHIDMDAFYASVEQRDHPELRGKPVAVGGSSLRGVVASASYEARQFGVKSAMPSVTAARLCPGLIFVKSRFEVYREVSQQIRGIFHTYTDLVEPLSLDEAYLDVTQPKRGPKSATLIAAAIRQQIRQETGLTASAGISFNKFLAKVASDINKPDGMKVIPPEEALAFLEQLPIKAFHGIGKVTAEKMRRMGIFNGEGLKRLSEIELVRRFGKAGRHYYRIVRALDDRPVNPNRIRKSIGAERTYREDIEDPAEMKEKLAYLAGVIFKYMQKSDNYGRTLTLKAKMPDFQIITRSKTFARELKRLEEITAVAYELLEEHREEMPRVRLLGLSVSNLQREQQAEGIQLEIDFEHPNLGNEPHEPDHF